MAKITQGLINEFNELQDGIDNGDLDYEEARERQDQISEEITAEINTVKNTIKDLFE